MESLATWNRTRIGKDIDSAVTICTIWVLPPVFTWRKGEGRGGGKEGWKTSSLNGQRLGFWI